jgi:hypothetical protein
MWADPTPWGFAALAAICLIFAGVFLDWWAPGNVPLIWVIGFCCGACQLVTAIVLLRNGNVIAGGLFGAFSMMFMWAPGLMILTHTLGWAPALDPLFGTWNIFLGILLWVWGVGLCRVGWFEFLVSPLGGLMMITAGLNHLVGLTGVVPGIFFLFFTFWGFYMCAHGLGHAARISVPIGKVVAPIK